MYLRAPLISFVFLSVFIAGCNDETVVQQVVDQTPKLAHIDISAPSSTVFTSLQFSAVGRYSDGSESDITSSVSWDTSANSVATIDAAGRVSPLSAGSTNISASLDGVSSRATSLTVPTSIVCGHSYGSEYSTAVNDTDPANAAGACIKIAEDSSSNWFTSNPSYDVARAVNFEQLHHSYLEDGTFGPNGGIFIRFKWFVNEDWCTHLNTINFADRSNWRMPTSTELSGLFTDLGNLWTGYGWPTWYYYFTSTQSGKDYIDVSLSSGSTSTISTFGHEYASCMSGS